METLKQRFNLKQVLDGGVSTEIAYSHGHPDIDNDPLWSSRLLSTDPETIKTVHKSFLNAGSDIIGSITYQASIEGFMKHLQMSENDAFGLIKQGVKLATDARNEFWDQNKGKSVQQDIPLVAGCMGPYGACLGDGSEYSGNYMDSVSLQTLEKFHKPRIAALIEGGADLIAFETVPAVQEGLLLAKLLKEFPETGAWLTFSCKDEQHIGNGENFAECCKKFKEYDQILGIGINCSSPQYIEPLLKSIPESVKQKKTIVIYANSGETWSEEKRWYFDRECPRVPDLVSSWSKLGAKWIGGCCRITPSDITQIRTNLNIQKD